MSARSHCWWVAVLLLMAYIRVNATVVGSKNAPGPDVTSANHEETAEHLPEQETHKEEGAGADADVETEKAAEEPKA